MSGYEQDFVHDAFASNWIAPLGPHVNEFERELAAYADVRYAIALSSGTAALHLALILSGVERGDEVICSTFTFSASANVIAYQQAVPVFIDSKADSWNIDPDCLEEELTELAHSGRKPKAVIAVDLYGQCADYSRIEPICKKFGVTLIEDAAEALGANCFGKKAGSFGKMATFSFNGNKIITTSGGGMLVSDDEEIVNRARFLATQARDPVPHYQHSTIGYNYRMSNILAAIGRGQLKVLDERVEVRRSIFEYYKQYLGQLPGISFMPEATYGRCTRWLTCIVVDPKVFGANREDVRISLEEANIEARPLWKPMHLQPVFAGCRVRGGAVSEELFDKGLCLPSGSAMTRGDQDRVGEIIANTRKKR